MSALPTGVQNACPKDKTVSRSLNAEQVERYQPWFDNARRLHELAIGQARAEGDWPEP